MELEEWNRLMYQAREHATITGSRVRIRAFRFSARSARYFNRQWIYTLQCPISCPCRSVSRG